MRNRDRVKKEKGQKIRERQSEMGVSGRKVETNKGREEEKRKEKSK